VVAPDADSADSLLLNAHASLLSIRMHNIFIENYVGSCLQWNGEDWWGTTHVHPDIELSLYFT